ncbi:MAG: thioredoxin domain-containing protein [Planctomycetota bacterium]
MRRELQILLWALVVQPVQPQEPAPVNRLAQETSPYLLQHQHNPVDWYPWGEEALARAKEEDKPIFLSIGYSACHWCHVMERESFESPEIAALLNEKFVNIKVDREERPDLDDIYMTAVVAMTGRGGWPMSVFMTPELVPFFGGTYFPPEDGRGMPGFKRVIDHIDRLWTEDRDRVDQATRDMQRVLAEQLQPEPQPGEPKHEHADRAAAMSLQRYDPEHGGFGQLPRFAPKFPHASELSLLLRHWARTDDAQSLEIVNSTLQHMLRGGIYDQLGGGFHRYSTDREWLVPHFEKMLYDNAQLVRTLLEAHLATGEQDYARIARETLDYLLREMQDEAGGFYSTQDADSEGVEGKFFVWDKAEIDAVAGDDAAAASLRWGVSEAGNWEGHNVLHVARSVESVAGELGQSVAEVEAALERARVALLARRETRIKPGTDDKVLAAWNGLAIAAFAVGHQVLDEPRYLDAARRAADFVLTQLRRDGRLLRTWRQGEARLDAYLEDYAFVAEALLVLFESDGDPRWLKEAKGMLDIMREHFRDPDDGALFFTADDHEKLVTRNKSISESSVPSGQAMAAIAFLRGGLLLGEPELEELGVGVLRAYHQVLESQPIAAPTLLLAVELHLGDPREVVVAASAPDGGVDDPRAREFLARAWQAFPPHRVVALLHDGNRAALTELAEVYEGKDAVDGKAAAYVCRRGVCEAPITEPAGLRL